MNDSRGCVCNKNTHECVLVDNKKAPTIDGCNVNISCPEANTPVCGKDGKTYANPCEAIRCNTVVACAGKCPCRTTPSVPSVPIMPSPNPGKCDVEDDCELCGAECFEQTMLSQLKMTGKTCIDTFDNLKCICQDGNCLAMPDVYDPDQPCEDILKLVCGTDGKTYQNKCEALKANTSVKCDGACPCEVNPPIMLCPTLYQPVCGTNNKTYKNTCFAQQAGAMIKCNQACPCPDSSITPPDNNLNPDVSPGTNPVLPVSLKETNVNGFCGLQTETTCGSDLDCRVAGCSGEICQAKSDGSINTTCSFKDCYVKPSNVYCGCDAGKCKWYGTLNTQLNNVYTPVINNPGTITTDQNGGISAPSILY